jgi:hypothetical protein
MSGPYRRGGGGAPRGPRPGRQATKAELDFNGLVKAESEKPLRQYVQFLVKTLDASSGEPWNLLTLVMALNRFGKESEKTRKKSGETPDPALLTPLLEKFTERFTRNTEGGFNAQQVGNAFFGLQGLDTATLDPAGLAALTKVLTVLADKAGTCREPLSAQAVGNAFFGLRQILASPATQSVANKIATQLVARMQTPALMKSNRADVARELACAVRCGHDARAALAASLDQVWAALETVLGNVEDGEAVTPIGLLALMESQQVYGLYRRAIPTAIEQMFERHQAGCEEFLTAQANEHRTEKVVCGYLQEILGVPVHMAGLHSGFELDLKLTYAEQCYNIELDGPHHQKLVQRLNDVQRDRFLDEAGVRVIRVPLTPGMDPKQVARQVVAELRNRTARK